MEALAKRGIRLVMNDVFTRIDKTTRGLKGVLRSGAELEADQVMFAIGRSPNTAGLGLEKAGVKTGPQGEIVVGSHSQSSVRGIYAVGDVTDRLNLTPVAIREGHAFADTMFGGKPTVVDLEQVPTAVFTTPEIGTVGLSEEDALARLKNIDIYKASFRPMRNTLSGRDERILMKLVVEAATDRVVGCHILGEHAAEIVQMAAIAIRLRATKADFDATMALHPTAAEELVTMREKWIAPAEAAG
jgi:glutathione reductase (NADPH)